MIDIDKVRNEFNKYVSNYNPEQPRVSLKIGHIKRVAKNCSMIAKELNLTDEEQNLAEAIGYFHDIGRFEQVRIADTFSDRDSKINHAEYGIKVLFDDNLIRNFIVDTKYDNIIKASVLNHNRAIIEEGLSEKELLFSKIIRDADKLDIFYTITVENFPALFWYKDFSCEKIGDVVFNEYKNHHLIQYKYAKSNADLVVVFCAYIYDLNFKESLDTSKVNNYLDKFTQRVIENFPSKTIHNQMQEVKKIYTEYLSK